MCGGTGICCGYMAGIRFSVPVVRSIFPDLLLIVLSFFPSFLLNNLSPFRHSPLPSGFTLSVKRKNWKKMRIQFTFAIPLKVLKTADSALLLVRKICEKGRKKRTVISDITCCQYSYIHDACCHRIHSLCFWQQALSAFSPAASTFFLILSDIPRLFSFLKKKSFIPGFGLCYKGF